MYSSLKEFRSAARTILFGKIFIAFVLIGIGLWATYIIISIVYMLFTDLSAIPFIGNLLSFPNDINVVSMGGDGLSMSGSIVAYIIAILLLSFGGRFTYKIIKLGVEMVSKLDMKFFYEKLWKEEEKLDESVKDSHTVL